MAKTKKNFVPTVTKKDEKVAIQRNHLNEYMGLVKKNKPEFGTMDHPCPDCDQYGEWIHIRDMYGIGVHAISGCHRCNGWGWLNDADFSCDHKDREMTSEEISEVKLYIYRCEHAYICTLCKRIEVVDSSG